MIKALVGVLSSPTSSYPLPDPVHDATRLYLDKHEDIEDQESQRVHDELGNLYHKLVAEHADKQPEFLAALGLLRPAIRGEERMMQWWKVLVRPAFDRLGRDDALASALRDFLLAVLVYEDDDDQDGELAQVSDAFTQELLDLYLEKTTIPGIDREGPLVVDDKARLVGNHLESILVDLGRRKPKVRACACACVCLLVAARPLRSRA